MMNQSKVMTNKVLIVTKGLQGLDGLAEEMLDLGNLGNKRVKIMIVYARAKQFYGRFKNRSLQFVVARLAKIEYFELERWTERLDNEYGACFTQQIFINIKEAEWSFLTKR